MEGSMNRPREIFGIDDCLPPTLPRGLQQGRFAQRITQRYRLPSTFFPAVVEVTMRANLFQRANLSQRFPPRYHTGLPIGAIEELLNALQGLNEHNDFRFNSWRETQLRKDQKSGEKHFNILCR
jgi:hypothetical protein